MLVFWGYLCGKVCINKISMEGIGIYRPYHPIALLSVSKTQPSYEHELLRFIPLSHQFLLFPLLFIIQTVLNGYIVQRDVLGCNSNLHLQWTNSVPWQTAWFQWWSFCRVMHRETKVLHHLGQITTKQGEKNQERTGIYSTLILMTSCWHWWETLIFRIILLISHKLQSLTAQSEASRIHNIGYTL